MIQTWGQAAGAWQSWSSEVDSAKPFPLWPMPALRKIPMGETQARKGTGKHPRPETAYAFSYEPPDFLRS